MKITPDSPIDESGLVQLIRLGNSIRHKWVDSSPNTRIISATRIHLSHFESLTRSVVSTLMLYIHVSTNETH